MSLPPRVLYPSLTVLLIAVGLMSRAPVLALPHVVAKYGGSIVWGGMMYFGLASLFPRLPVLTLAIVTGAVAAAIEFSQLWHVGWLDEFRRTAFGVLLIG